MFLYADVQIRQNLSACHPLPQQLLSHTLFLWLSPLPLLSHSRHFSPSPAMFSLQPPKYHSNLAMFMSNSESKYQTISCTRRGSLCFILFYNTNTNDEKHSIEEVWILNIYLTTHSSYLWKMLLDDFSCDTVRMKQNRVVLILF